MLELKMKTKKITGEIGMKNCIIYFLLITCLTPQVAGQERADIKNIKTLCLEVNEIYPDINENFSLPLEGKIKQFLSGMGMTILPVGETCDANLEVLFKGTATKLEFTSGVGQLMDCYAQADYMIEMTLTLIETGGNYRSESNDSFTSRLVYGDSCIQDAKKAPFDQAWQKGLLESLSGLWPSSKVYMNALETEDRRFHIPALRFYFSNKPVLEAIPSLMRLLKSAEEEKPQGGFSLGPAIQGGVRVGKYVVNPQSNWDVQWIQMNGAGAFNEFGPEDVGAVPYFCKYLLNSSKIERAISAEVLGHIGPNAAVAVPDLCKFLQDSEPYLRAKGAVALGRIGPAAIDAVPYLINALREAKSKGDKNKNYVDVLKKITGQNFGKKPDRWQQWWEENQGK